MHDLQTWSEDEVTIKRQPERIPYCTPATPTNLSKQQPQNTNVKTRLTIDIEKKT